MLYSQLRKLASISPDEIPELTQDIHRHMMVFGPEETARIIPKEDLLQKIVETQRQTPKEIALNVLGALGGAGAGAGVGLLTSRLATGHVSPRSAILTALPSTIIGYGLSQAHQQKSKLRRLLENEYLGD